jgi:hypothetical protein
MRAAFKAIPAALALCGAICGAPSDDRNWRIDQHESMEKTFDVPAGGGSRRLLVDNVSGFIHVTGSSGNQVRVKVDRETRAWSEETAREAARDVKLDMSQQGNFVRLYADGPFRGADGMHYRGDDYYGYRVIFNIEIETPSDIEVVLKNLNSPIEVKRITGEYDIHGLNGGIEVRDIAGSGTIQTLNGPVKVWYTHNPQRETHYKTLNGSIEVHFAGAPDADMQFHRLNGEVYTDFDLTALPLIDSSVDGSGRFLYRSNGRSVAGRAGKGGPKLDFDTLNGSIRLYSKGL